MTTATKACLAFETLALLGIACSFLIGCHRRPQTGQPLPPTAEGLLLEVGFTKADFAASQFVSDGVDGWWVGISAPEPALLFFEERWLPVDKQPPDRAQNLTKFFRDWIPRSWDALANSTSTRLFIHPDWDPSIEGTENFMACYSVNDRYLLIWCYENF